MQTGNEHRALPPESVAGDGVTPGEAVGGWFNRSGASPGAWCTVSIVPDLKTDALSNTKEAHDGP